MKANQIITAAELESIISKHGVGTVSIDGEMPRDYKSFAQLGIDAEDTFCVIINYGMAVQFHLLSIDMRAIITTGLCAEVINMEWAA